MKITPADVNDPLYYLHNFLTALNWVLQHSKDLLSRDEQQQTDIFLSLDIPSQALLLRMVMRKGELFRLSSLHYTEIADLSQALRQLQVHQFCEINPALNVHSLTELLKKDELLRLIQRQVNSDDIPADIKRWKKPQISAFIQETFSEDDLRPATGWLPAESEEQQLIRLNVMPLFDGIRLLFFGNHWQDWTEFVVTELGHQSYEAVPLTTTSRPFRQRSEVDFYRQLTAIQEQLAIVSDQLRLKAVTAEGAAQSLALCAKELLAIKTTVEFGLLPLWLTQRWHKLLAKTGREFERCNELPLALSCYQLSTDREAHARYLRVLELQAQSAQDYHHLLQQAEHYLAMTSQPETRISMQRIRQRAAKKAAVKLPAEELKKDLPRAIKNYPSIYISVDDNSEHVEYQALDYLQRQRQQQFSSGQYHYVENTLLPGLFALLFWPPIYAPVSGAFFHPFQAGPADLFRDYFPQLRQTEINTAFNALQDGNYKTLILKRWQQKQGISCPLINWPWLSEEVVNQALQAILPAQLEAIFRHLLRDLKNHCRGLPDLIWLGDQPGEWQLIEVKGPGDRLQDHQKLWLEFFLQQAIDAQVCYVSFNSGSADVPAPEQ